MTEQPPDQSHSPAEAPVDPLYTHPASPFFQTQAPEPVVLAPMPSPQHAASSSWVLRRTPIEFGLGILAYLMVLVGSVTVVQANPTADWRYYVAVLPVFPAALVIWMFVRALARLDEMQKRIQLQAFGFSLGATGLVTFGYGFLEGAGLPHLSWTYVLPLMAVLWGVGAAIFTWRYR
jgi:hypothetical protein